MEFNKIFVVYDPTRSEQPALDRALAIVGAADVKVHIYACIHAELEEGNKPLEVPKLIAAQQAALEPVLAPFKERGVEASLEVEWGKNWYQAVVRAAERQRTDLVLKSTYRHSSARRFLNRTSDWTLIRECQCPVLLVKEGEPREGSRILAAIDGRSEQPRYEELNKKLISFSRRVSESANSEVHFISAFRELHEFPDKNSLVESCGVPGEQVHIRLGKPEDVIVQGARDIDASLVVVGNAARSGLSAVVNGNTVEKVLDRLECDVLSMP